MNSFERMLFTACEIIGFIIVITLTSAFVFVTVISLVKL